VFEDRLSPSQVRATQALVPIPTHQTNGDQNVIPTAPPRNTKALLQDSIGLVNLAAYQPS